MTQDAKGFGQTLMGRFYAGPSPEEKAVYDLVEMIDLDIMFSPVVEELLPEGYLFSSHLPQPVEARKTGKGYLIIQDSSNPATSAREVTTDELTVMRARYMKIRGDIDREWNRLGHQTRVLAVSLYFNGLYFRLPGR